MKKKKNDLKKAGIEVDKIVGHFFLRHTRQRRRREISSRKKDSFVLPRTRYVVNCLPNNYGMRNMSEPPPTDLPPFIEYNPLW